MAWEALEQTYQPAIEPAALEVFYNEPLPLVISVPELTSDSLVRLRARQFIGAVATDSVIERPAVEKPIESLYEALHLAAEGDPVARQLVEINAATDVIERTIKTGHVLTPVPLIITPEGKLVQHRQSFESVQANSLRMMEGHSIMQARTEAETRNAFRLEALNSEGYFDEGYSLVVFSRAEDLPEAGFFTETMSCSIQVTTKHGQILTTESAFVAGIKELGSNQHDKVTIIKLGAALGVDLAAKSPAEVIDTPLLIHNSLIPNGAIDLVKLYDDCAGGTFFGENKPRQDYLEYREQCVARGQTFKPKVDKIVSELIAEAPLINSPLMATQRLHKVSEKHMVDYAIEDKTIDPRVFGRAASVHIENARLQFELGNEQQARAEVSAAKLSARSSSCPSALGLTSCDKNGNDTMGSGKDQFGSLTFKCPKGHLNTRPRGSLIDECKVCHISVKC